MEKLIEWIDESIKSQQAIAEEYESDPTSDQYQTAMDNIQKLLTMRLTITNADLDKEEKLRTLELKERELNSKIDEINDRMIIEQKKLYFNTGTMIVVIVGLTAYERYGHIFKDGTFKIYNTVRRAIIG